MSIPHCFDHLLGAKPKHLHVGALAAPQSVDEIAPLSQIPGLNITQFKNIGNFRPNVAQHIPRPSTRACRARNLFNWSINWVATKINTGQVLLTPDMNWVMSFLHLPTRVWQTHLHVLELNCNSSPHHMTLIKDHWTTWKRCEDYFHSSNSLTQISVKSLPLYISPSSGLFFISPDEDLLFEVETSWVKLLCKFQCWWSELNWCCKRYQRCNTMLQGFKILSNFCIDNLSH